MTHPTAPKLREPLTLLAGALAVLVVSGIGPRDRFTWLLEVAPILLGLPVLVATARGFPLTPLLYRLTLGRVHERQLTRMALPGSGPRL